MAPQSSDLVSAKTLEGLLAWAAGEPSDSNPSCGIFGPASINWRINRESALFLAAGRAALLQMAHPWVARALEEHSTTLSDPIRRFHNTFRVIFTMVFGTRNQAMGAARKLHHLHTHICGSIPEPIGSYARGSQYAANDLAALRWVFATLIDSAVLAYELVLPLSGEERDAYYRESLRMAALFGIAPQALPHDWAAFMAYNREMWSSDLLTVSPVAHAMGQRILQGAGSWIHIPQWYRALTAGMMPPRLREAFGLDYGRAERKAEDRAKRWLPHIYPRLPEVLRFVGPYREAEARLQGKRPGWTVRLSSKFWIGI